MTQYPLRLPGNPVLLTVGLLSGARALMHEQPASGCNVRRLLSAWRVRRLPVIHVECPLPGGGSGPLSNSCAPCAGEVVLRLRHRRGFFGKTLRARLRREGLQSVVVVGADASGAVEAVVRTLGMFGFEAYVVGDATSGADVRLPDGRILSAADVRAVTLATLDGHEATVTETEAILLALARSGGRPPIADVRDQGPVALAR